MGKNFHRGNGARGGRGRGSNRGKRGGGGGRGATREWGSRSEIKRANERFESYYNGLDIVSDEDGEREQFWQSLRSELPNSFRFAGSKGHALAVQRLLIERYIPEITSVKWDGEFVTPPEPIPWYPHQLAWSMSTPKNIVRKFAPFASFQKFLVSENNVGNITRQEIVSMIPPLVMDLRPGMTVLDLCAAPGSKSSQLLELVHGGEETRVRKILEKIAAETGRELTPPGPEVEAEEAEVAAEEEWSDDGRSTGLLVANDVDYRRAQMLIHQCKRLNSPNLIVTNHDAILYPSIKIPSESGNRYLKFDRILADVPCSGDGTARKNPEIWKDWSPAKGLGLHLTQVRILVRALQMLKVGGQLVYSTCSMNPIENEAVVSSAIQRCGGSSHVKILDRSEFLHGLKRRPGLSTWKVLDKAGRWWNSWSEVSKVKEEQGEEGTSRLIPGMFPPNPEDEISLDLCMRIYPHLQDTGGFFITVLEKQTEIRAKPEHQHNSNAAVAQTTVSAPVPTQPDQAASIMDVARAIQNQTDEAANGLEKIDALDKIMPPTEDNELFDGDASAVARQNQPNEPTGDSSPRKRALDAQADAIASTKRLKTRDEVDEPAETGNELRKVHWPPPPGAMLEATAHKSRESNGGTPLPKHKSNAPHEEPFIFLPADHPELVEIYNYYDLSPRFPRDRFMVRNATGQPVKSIYYASDLARQILQENEGKGLKFVHCGVKMFVKQDINNQPHACKWRIQSEGLPIIEPWVGEERIVRLTKRSTLRKLLIEMFPRIANDAHLELPDIGERVIGMNVGCCVLRVEPSTDEDGFEERMVMPLWKGQSSLNLMLPKEERQAALLRLFNETAELVNHSQGYKEKNMRQGQAASDGQAVNGTEGSSSAAHTESAAPAEDDYVSDDDDDENGGIPLPATEDTRPGLTENRMEQIQDVMLARKQHEKDQSREVAPGITDEEEAFNTTV